MKFSSRTVAELAALTETFDDPDIDLQRSLTRLAEQVRLAVPSYLGGTMVIATAGEVMNFEMREDVVGPDDIRSSLLIPVSAALPGDAGRTDGRRDISLVLYAAAPGALVDLAADLGWLTALPLSDFVLDEHLAGPGPTGGSLDATSLLNQVIGVLLGRGQTPEEALAGIGARAVGAGISRQAAAAAILAEVGDRADEPEAEEPLAPA